MAECRPQNYPKLKDYKPSRFMLPTCHYDAAKADRAVTFIENLRHTKGKWAGKRFWLLPWQEQIIRDVFGIVDEKGKYIMLPFFWIPEDTIPQRVRRASVPYDVWYQQGYLMATEGNVIHYGFIEKVIEELGKTYHILEIAFDRWGAVQMTQNLEGMGFTVVPFGQGFKDMSPPTKEFYKLLMEGRITHGGNPVMAWMAGNVVVDTDPAGNIKPTKAKSPEKIDGIVAAIMALDRCIRNEGQQQGSVYDERDMIVF